LVLFLIHLQFVYLFCNLSVMQVNLVLRSDHHMVYGATILKYIRKFSNRQLNI